MVTIKKIIISTFSEVFLSKTDVMWRYCGVVTEFAIFSGFSNMQVKRSVNVVIMRGQSFSYDENYDHSTTPEDPLENADLDDFIDKIC